MSNQLVTLCYRSHQLALDVAKRAGVGVGSVSRHFPTKEALVSALAASLFAPVVVSRAHV